MFHNLTKGAKIIPLKIDGTNYLLAAGTTDVDSEGIDCDGFDGIVFCLLVGTISSSGAVTVKAQQSSDDAVADGYSDLTGSSNGLDDTGSNKALIIDIFKPQKRYQRIDIVRGNGGNSVLNAGFAILYHAANEPVTQSSRV